VSMEMTCPLCGKRAESFLALGDGSSMVGCSCIEGNKAVQVRPITWTFPTKYVEINKARIRLENAALRIGDLFAAEIDPGWDECQELEAAALEYRNAYRASEPGASK
jgi:hypothetical protein